MTESPHVIVVDARYSDDRKDSGLGETAILRCVLTVEFALRALDTGLE